MGTSLVFVLRAPFPKGASSSSATAQANALDPRLQKIQSSTVKPKSTQAGSDLSSASSTAGTMQACANGGLAAENPTRGSFKR